MTDSEEERELKLLRCSLFVDDCDGPSPFVRCRNFGPASVNAEVDDVTDNQSNFIIIIRKIL